MKTKILAIISMSICSLTFAKETLIKDHLDRAILKKTFEISDPAGKTVQIDQSFLIISNEELLYLRDSSSPETLRFGEKKCQAEGKILDINFGAKIVNKNIKYLISCSDDLNLKNTMINKAYSLQPKEQLSNGFSDIVSYNQYGEKIIIRSSQATGPNGKQYSLQQRFQEISPEKLLYISNSSTPETLQYNNEICKSINGTDNTDKGVRIISKLTTSTLVCDNIKKNEVGLLNSERSCNITAQSNSNYNGRAYSNNLVSGNFRYTNASGRFVKKITLNGYYNEIVDYVSNQTGNSQIFLNAYIGAPNPYAFVTTGQLGCTSSSQGVLIAN